MRKLYYAGTFNPVHHGHLICSRWIAENSHFQQVVLMPSEQNPLKQGVEATGLDRLEMCRRAVAGSSLFAVSDLELKRGGPSFTIDTVRQLKRLGESEVHWLFGADQLPTLPKWREAAALVAEAHFVIMARPGFHMDWDAIPEPFRKLRDNLIQGPLIDISATDIRRRIATGLPIDYLTPPAVADYIRDRGLYQQKP